MSWPVCLSLFSEEAELADMEQIVTETQRAVPFKPAKELDQVRLHRIRPDLESTVVLRKSFTDRAGLKG